MRAIAIFFAAILAFSVSEARADGCQAAVARFNQAVIAEAKVTVAEFQKIFGMTPAAYLAAHHTTTLVSPEFCMKGMGFLPGYISRGEALRPFYNAVQSACSRLQYLHNPVRGGAPGPLSFEAVLAKRMSDNADCARINVAANAGAATPASPSAQKAPPNAPANQAAQSDQIAEATPQQPPASNEAQNGSGASKALPIPPTVPAPTAGAESRQQITVARRSEESSIFQSRSSSSSSSSAGCTDDVGPGMLLVDPGISLIGSGDCPSIGKASAPGARPNQRGAGSRNQNLSALYLLNKRYPKEVPPITAQDLQCMRADPQGGSDPQKLPPLRLCPGRDWDLGTMWINGIAATGLCKGITDADEYHDCAEKNYGAAVITVMPEMSSYCYEGPDYSMDDVAKCAGRKFKKAWNDRIFNDIPPDDNCAVIPPPPPPTWTTPGTASCKPKRQSLRDLMKATLCKDNPDSCNTADDDDTAVPNNPQQQQKKQADEPPQPLPTENEAWCNFMADAHRRGDLGGIPIPDACPREKAVYDKPPDGPSFAMSPVDTDRWIKELEDDWCSDEHSYCPGWKPPK